MIKIIKVPKTKPIVIQSTLMELADLERFGIIDIIGIEIIKPTSSEWTSLVEAEVKLKKEASKELLNSSEIAMLFFTKLFNSIIKPQGGKK